MVKAYTDVWGKRRKKFPSSVLTSIKKIKKCLIPSSDLERNGLRIE